MKDHCETQCKALFFTAVARSDVSDARSSIQSTGLKSVFSNSGLQRAPDCSVAGGIELTMNAFRFDLWLGHLILESAPIHLTSSSLELNEISLLRIRFLEGKNKNKTEETNQRDRCLFLILCHQPSSSAV